MNTLPCVNCKITHYVSESCTFYEDIVKALKLASQPLYNFPKCNSKCPPGWNVHVADLHKAAWCLFIVEGTG